MKKYRFLNKRIAGFTLAEVLLTLAVIGVVAAMTVPTLMTNINEDQYKVSYKKAYSDISQALNKVKFDNPRLSTANAFDAPEYVKIFNLLKAEFKVVKDCNSNNAYDCYTDDGELWRTYSPYSFSPAFIDNAGRSWVLRGNSATTTLYNHIILVDTNGNKKPNQLGKDRFPLVFSNGKAIPPENSKLGAYNVVAGGEIVKIQPYADMIDNDEDKCPNPPCYNTSWLVK